MLPDLIISIIDLGLDIIILILFSIHAMTGWEFIESYIPGEYPNWSDAANGGKSPYGVIIFGTWIGIVITTCKYTIASNYVSSSYENSNIAFSLIFTAIQWCFTRTRIRLVYRRGSCFINDVLSKIPII